jgi:predicted small metal-binding protein
MVVLDREELKEIVERILKHAYEMGRYDGMQEIRDEWIEYMTKQLERNQ